VDKNPILLSLIEFTLADGLARSNQFRRDELREIRDVMPPVNGWWHRRIAACLSNPRQLNTAPVHCRNWCWAPGLVNTSEGIVVDVIQLEIFH
jgi:hypothetical protein